ncbi:hypothetical protein [Azonexus sp. R2A61]|uniref:GAP1-N1 domain-containing protein n=1 Tax=Azonexus sp. R2A61 TaxID=2744443 RepID=UPI001F40787E|nr:hypothetical protein [Azonexus sp. R2A61]
MQQSVVHQQVHAYRGGHELISSSIKLEERDQDLIDRLSDLAGPIGPGDQFDAYLTLYPLPSANYYVFARTWQDFSAARAGCVVTRSLIVPIAFWESSTGILAALYSELKEFKRADAGVSDIVVASNPCAPFKPIRDGMTAELLEALFLESRQPIVIVDTPNADLVTLRLMEAFWPSLRRSFSACTHAYSPRGIEGRPFDLLFAPSGAWSNYGHWQGRQIDGRSLSKPRHRWTEFLSQRIFENPIPMPLLGAFGSLNLSSDDIDESTLRLYLMWNELEQRAESSPQAVLGLLDIASTRKDPKLIESLFPLVDRSLELAAGSFAPPDLLAYLQTLLGKFPSSLPPKTILRKIRKHTLEASLLEPRAALDTLARAPENPIPVVMVAGIGDGLAASSSLTNLIAPVLGLGRDAVQLLLGFSKKFAGRFIQMVEEAEDLKTYQHLAAILETRDQVRRSRLRRNILPHLRSPGWEESLKVLLISSTPASISSAVKALWGANKLEIEKFGLALRDAADDPKKLGALRSALVCLPSSSAIDCVVISTVGMNEQDVNWLFTSASERSRKSRWSEMLVDRATEWEIRALPERSIEILISLLETGLPKTARHMAELLVQSQSVLNRSIHIVGSLIPCVDAHVADRLVSMGIEGILTGRANCELNESATFFNSHANKVPPRDLVLMLVGGRSDVERVSNNLMLLEGAPDSIKSNIAPSVDDLSDSLSKRHGLVPSKDAIDSWADFIQFSGNIAESAQFRAASTALEYAFQRKHLDVSSLVVTCFPIVYENLRQGRSTPSFLSHFIFVDWDRCRTARNELVDAFLGSVWPPSNLIVTAIYVDELQEVINILMRKKSGREYLERMASDLVDLPETLRSKFLSLLERKG